MTVSAWTPERVERLRALWREGRSAEQIARELDHGISRSAVLGKVYRLGLSEGRPGRSVARKRPRAPPRPQRSPSAVSTRSGTGVTKNAEASSGPMPERPVDGPDILAVRRGQCRWPYGEPGADLVFCGRPVARGAFCAAHADIGYQAPREGSASLLALAGLA